MADRPLSFTVTSNEGRLRVLQCDVHVVGGPLDLDNLPHDANGFYRFASSSLHKFVAIWDTGATNSVITQAVVDACGLKPIGIAEVHGIDGIELHERFLVHIGVPNQYMFRDVVVTKAKLPGGALGDVLVGMDIIGMGDFAVTSKGGRTVFSFRTPSQARIDFVQEGRAQVPMPRQRQQKSKRPPKRFGRNK